LLLEGSTAWRKENCRLILQAWDSQSPFEQKLRNEALLMYGLWLDLVKAELDETGMRGE
jgi:hypothetical protein